MLCLSHLKIIILARAYHACLGCVRGSYVTVLNLAGSARVWEGTLATSSWVIVIQGWLTHREQAAFCRKILKLVPLKLGALYRWLFPVLNPAQAFFSPTHTPMDQPHIATALIVAAQSLKCTWVRTNVPFAILLVLPHSGNQWACCQPVAVLRWWAPDHFCTGLKSSKHSGGIRSEESDIELLWCLLWSPLIETSFVGEQRLFF